MADNYLEKKYDEYLERKAAAEKTRRLTWKKRMDAYRKKLEEEAQKQEKADIDNATEILPKAGKEDKPTE